MIKFLNAQAIAPIEIDRQLCQVYGQADGKFVLLGYLTMLYQLVGYVALNFDGIDDSAVVFCELRQIKAGLLDDLGSMLELLQILIGNNALPKIPSVSPTVITAANILANSSVVVITEDVQNVHLLLEYRPHIDVSLTCEHDPKLQEYCVCPQNMPQFDSEGIPNQALETNKPMILNGSTSRNREGSDQVSVEAKQLGHLYLSIDQETFDPSTGEPYD
ncbi:hypothetical protein ANN_08376 [Periplaneta americana]|uniref:Uncharacterized protein n=1 Tax=Periplaneta americana TaxID=6978 RepID=A0ABQ8T2V4_PERAM|nr:hypothetical protein ANN_08376 [Periplaneta americana]